MSGDRKSDRRDRELLDVGRSQGRIESTVCTREATLRSRRWILACACGVASGLAGCSTTGERGQSPGSPTGTEGSDDGTIGGDRGASATATSTDRTGTETGEGEADRTTGTDGTTTSGGTPTVTGDLDLREANVTGVGFESDGDGSYRFSVTLFHDDEGEEGYANWWQVETVDGRRLGRRELLHAHGTREFTRSETLPVPASADRVVVRGHDRTHGYGGQAALVDLATGDVQFVRQGSEPQPIGP